MRLRGSLGGSEHDPCRSTREIELRLLVHQSVADIRLDCPTAATSGKSLISAATKAIGKAGRRGGGISARSGAAALRGGAPMRKNAIAHPTRSHVCMDLNRLEDSCLGERVGE